mgnify:CR=1 FL=1
MEFVLGVLNPHAVEIGSVVIHWYGVIIAAGILAALQLSTKEAKKKGLEEDTIIDMALWEFRLDSSALGFIMCYLNVVIICKIQDKSLRFGMAALRFMWG